jgi:hypothetical protein
VRVEKSRIKVALLLACRYKLSRPIKDRRARTRHISRRREDLHETGTGWSDGTIGLVSETRRKDGL